MELPGCSPHLATSFPSVLGHVQGTPSFPYTLVSSGSPAEETSERDRFVWRDLVPPECSFGEKQFEVSSPI